MNRIVHQKRDVENCHSAVIKQEISRLLYPLIAMSPTWALTRVALKCGFVYGFFFSFAVFILDFFGEHSVLKLPKIKTNCINQ